MRFRSSALALLGALAFLLASTGAHRHADGPGLDKPCAVCAARAHSVATCADPAIQPAIEPQLALELFHPAPLSRDLRTRDSAAPRGPPLTA